MATFEALQTSWSNLGQALDDACANTDGGECTGALVRLGQISGRVADWNRLPDESAGYDTVIATLDHASQQLAGGASSGALSSANEAMDQVETLLDNA
jgi:hypothetical protein